MKRSFTHLIFGSFLGFASSSAAQVVFTDDLSTGTNWTIAADADTSSTFGYDYSADGIPAAPNGGGDTVGLKLEANIVDPAEAAEIAAVHALAGGDIGSAFQVRFDMWANFTLGTGTSTEFIGGGVGHDGVETGRNAASLIATGDGGSTRDYRLYKNDGEQFLASGQYDIASVNGEDPPLSTTFLGLAAPAAQGQAGTSDAGDSAFQWITMTVDVDPNAILQGTTNDPGTAKFTMFSHASGTSLEIGTIDNSNGGTVVNMDGSIALIYADIFSSVAIDPQFQFGIFDNVVVAIPEPTTGALLGLAGLGLFLRRRR